MGLWGYGAMKAMGLWGYGAMKAMGLCGPFTLRIVHRRSGGTSWPMRQMPLSSPGIQGANRPTTASTPHRPMAP